MVEKNLAGKTYDVLTLSDGRWLISSTHAERSAALDAAETLLDGDVAGVRVVAESQRTGNEEVIFEELSDGGGKKLAIVPIEGAPICRNIADVYGFPSRQAVGRLLRRYLDDVGMTALELMASSGNLRMLERNDALFGPGMQRLGSVQAKAAGEKPGERIDALYALFAEAKDVVAALGDDDSLEQILAKADMAAVVDAAGKMYADAARRDIAILNAVAGRLAAAGDWNGKIDTVLRLADGASTSVIARYLDGAIAEIVDGSAAVVDLLGGMDDAAAAYRNLAQLAKGKCELSSDRSAVERLNEALGRHAFVQTRSVLLERVATGLRGTRPLTKEGLDAESMALSAIVRDLVEDAGLSGGPAMAEAVAMRARIVFKSGDDDLSFSEAFAEVMKALPNRAVQLGYLLDLLASPSGEAGAEAIIARLKALVVSLKGASSLVQEGAGRDAVHRAVDGLRPRLSAEALPAEFREIFTKAFDSMLGEASGPTGSAASAKPEPEAAPETAEIRVERAAEAATSFMRRNEKAGTILFEEGDAGDEAYLVASGAVEIFRRHGEREVPIAMLERGEIFGEMALIDNSPRVASARAVGDTMLTIISRADFTQRLDNLADTDKVFRRLIDIFSARLRGEVSRRR